LKQLKDKSGCFLSGRDRCPRSVYKSSYYWNVWFGIKFVPFHFNHNGIDQKPFHKMYVYIVTQDNPDYNRVNQPKWTENRKMNGGLEFMGMVRPNICLSVVFKYGVIDWSTLKVVFVRDWWLEVPIIFKCKFGDLK
jgi:hypothetical protein